MIEHEIKVLDIDIENIKTLLHKLWAQEIWTKFFRRYVYDMNPADPHKWIRLRTDGEKSTLTIKHIIQPDAIDGVQEWEVEVSDFQQTHFILEQLWYQAKWYQENKRESFLYNNCSIDIDSWPLIPPYLEIEWENKNSILSTLKELNFDNEVTSENTTQIYLKYGLNITDYPILSFSTTR